MCRGAFGVDLHICLYIFVSTYFLYICLYIFVSIYLFLYIFFTKLSLYRIEHKTRLDKIERVFLVGRVTGS